jgi:hypothetical protein
LTGAAGRQRLDDIMKMLNSHLGDREKRKRDRVAEQLERASVRQVIEPVPEPAPDEAVSPIPAVDEDEIGLL